VTGIAGAAALRVYSPLARRIGHYPGDIEALQQRARDQKPLRPVELLPWAELLARVEKPAADVEE